MTSLPYRVAHRRRASRARAASFRAASGSLRRIRRRSCPADLERSCLNSIVSFRIAERWSFGPAFAAHLRALHAVGICAARATLQPSSASARPCPRAPCPAGLALGVLQPLQGRLACAASSAPLAAACRIWSAASRLGRRVHQSGRYSPGPLSRPALFSTCSRAAAGWHRSAACVRRRTRRSRSASCSAAGRAPSASRRDRRPSDPTAAAARAGRLTIPILSTRARTGPRDLGHGSAPAAAVPLRRCMRTVLRTPPPLLQDLQRLLLESMAGPARLRSLPRLLIPPPLRQPLGHLLRPVCWTSRLFIRVTSAPLPSASPATAHHGAYPTEYGGRHGLAVAIALRLRR